MNGSHSDRLKALVTVVALSPGLALAIPSPLQADEHGLERRSTLVPEEISSSVSRSVARAAGPERRESTSSPSGAGPGEGAAATGEAPEPSTTGEAAPAESTTDSPAPDGTDTAAPPAEGDGTDDTTLEGAAPEGLPDESSSIPEEYIPAGESVSRGSGFRLKGYFRGEYKYNRLNLYQGFDDQLGRWTPRGSPYMAFALLTPEDHDSYLELNFEASWQRFDFLTLYTDTSFVYSTTAPVQSTFEELQDALIATGMAGIDETPSSGIPIPGAAGGQFVRQAQERLLLNELYLTTGLENWFSLVAGKRRIFWGSAFTWSPMDVINPPRNPLEPTLLREGSYNATLDLVHFDNWSATLLYKPTVVENERGLPTEWDFSESLWVGRAYINLFDADFNLALYHNRGGAYSTFNADEDGPDLGRNYVGLSFSRYFDVVEAHLEALFQRGRPTWLVRELDLADDPYAADKPPYEVGQFDIQDGKIYGDILVGARYNFSDNSFLLGEYLYHGAGHTRAEFDNLRSFTAYMQEQVPHLVPELAQTSDLPPEAQAEIQEAWFNMLSGAPYLYQEANLRRHYLGLTFMKSRMFGLIEPKISTVLNLDDLSGTLYPSVDFVLSRDSGGRGTVKMLAGVLIFLGGPESQASIFPNRFTANLRMSAYF